VRTYLQVTELSDKRRENRDETGLPQVHFFRPTMKSIQAESNSESSSKKGTGRPPACSGSRTSLNYFHGP